MADVRVEQVELDRGIPMMYREFEGYVRLAHDPRQMTEAAALALLCVHLPHLVGHLQVRQAR